MGKLSIVATPIGNLGDITLRALETLKACDVIYAEDTRVIAKLLARYEIKKPLQRLDATTEAKKAEEIINRLEAGEHVVYVSDAGTPGISDPGARLVRHIRAQCPPVASSEGGNERMSAGEIKIEAIPGPSALTAALSIAGLEETSFSFLGFLPHKKGRQTALKKVEESDVPIMLYESPHRILKLLKELEALDIKKVTIARELTKIHEELLSDSPTSLLAHFSAHPSTVRGEFVVIVETR